MNVKKLIWPIFRASKKGIHLILVKMPLGNKLIYWFRQPIWKLASVVVPNPILVKGYKMYWHPAVCSNVVEYHISEYEPDTSRLLEELLSPNMIALDIGANIGYFSLLFAREMEGNGKVYSFEPQPVNCEVLRKSVHANGLDNIIIVIPKAVSDRPGTVNLHFSKMGALDASIYKRKNLNKLMNIEVESTTLDKFLESEGWPQIDIIKMDIEGAEKVALEGARQFIERSPNLKMIIEFGPEVQANAGVTPESFFNTLVDVGFQKFSMVQNSLQLLKIPQDIPYLVNKAGDKCINLLCEK